VTPSRGRNASALDFFNKIRRKGSFPQLWLLAPCLEQAIAQQTLGRTGALRAVKHLAYDSDKSCADPNYAQIR
jgi:hypothetical protein